MANKRKNKKKNAAAKQKAAAAYMSKKNAPVQKTQAHKAAPAPKAQPTEANQTKETPAKPVPERITQPNPTPEKPMQPKPAQAKVNPAAKKPAARKPAPSGKPRPKRKKQPLKLKDLRMDRVLAVVLVFLVLVAGVTALVYWLSTRFVVPDGAVLNYRGINCSTSELYEIQVDAIEQSRLASEMKRKGDVKKFEYYAADKLIIPDKGEPGWLNLSNAFNNKCVLLASIVDEAGNVCARTRGIPAGYTYGEITLSWSVPYGTHPMHLVVSAYDVKTYELVGVQYSDLTVQVGTEEEMTDG